MPYYACFVNTEIYILISESDLEELLKKDPNSVQNKDNLKRFRQLTDAKKYLRAEFMGEIRKTRNALNEVLKYKARD